MFIKAFAFDDIKQVVFFTQSEKSSSLILIAISYALQEVRRVKNALKTNF